MSARFVAAAVAEGSALAAVLSVLPWPFRPARSGGHAQAQEVRIRVKGGYEPSCIVVRAGMPVRLTFRREETAACSEQVVFPDLGRSAMLPAFEDVAVELPAVEPGEHEFTCQMGVLRGRLIALANTGPHGGEGTPSGAGRPRRDTTDRDAWLDRPGR